MKVIVWLVTLTFVSVFAADITSVNREGRTVTVTNVAAESVSIPWSEVDAIYNPKSDETELRKEEAWNRYKGKRVRWSGTLISASKSSGSVILWLRMNPDKSGSDLSVALKDSQQARALAFKKGDPVAFTAILESWGAITPLSLDDGEIVEQKEPDVRPRRLHEALARQPDNQLEGQKVKHKDEPPRRLETTLFDAVSTPLGAYDRSLIEAVNTHWNALLDERMYARHNRGKVVLQFVLHPDGYITDMTMSENTAGEVFGYICEKAVLDPAPFSSWPTEMRRTIGKNRPIQFTFYYDD